jgi:hypothetical protein
VVGPTGKTGPSPLPSGPSNAVGGAAPRPNSSTKSFSTTRVVGTVRMRILLPSMRDPITYSDVPVKQYTKLPNHRPPLRRDKPVRISLPQHATGYIFPSVDRSFIFIPRALRPNQQGFGRGKGVGSFGGFSSRRTSVWGGSMYSPSIALSRRSSFARDGMASPAGSMVSGRPVVRLPPGAHHPHSASGTPAQSAGISSAAGTPAFGVSQGPVAMAQKPIYRENWPSNIQMHQPRPQKTISVTGIEYPASRMNFQGPAAGEQQAFHHQVPQHVNGILPQQDHGGYSHSRQQSYPLHPGSGTPLSNIPERAIHAQPFQPYQQAVYAPAPYGGQPAYYYPGVNPATGHFAPGAVIAPMYVASAQQGGFIVSTIATAAAPPAPPPQQDSQQNGPPGMVAYEQNGMVYYYDPSQVYVTAEGYSQPNYAMSVPGVGAMITAAPDGYYYPQSPSGNMYYGQH